MAPPRKAPEDGKVDFHASFVPLSAPVCFVNNRTVCYAVADNVCLWNIEDGSRSYLHTTVYGITKLCCNAERGMVAFCEGGASPQVFVYSMEPKKLMFAISDVAELELADMAFSRCGSRLYVLSRATSKKLAVFSMQTGLRLKGCDLDLPLRFDKLSVYPGHKDHLALIRGSSVRIVTITKSFETYISRLQPPSIPADAELSVSAYAWTTSGHFLVATRQGSLCTLDGGTGVLLHVCQAERPITSITMTRSHLVTSHIGNNLSFWSYSPEALPAVTDEAVQEISGLSDAPAMSSAANGGVFKLNKVLDLESVSQSQRLGHRMLGQVACVQLNPDFSQAVLTTAEGEVWSLELPPKLNQEGGAFPTLDPTDDEEEEEDIYMRADQLQTQLLTWFHTHPVADIAILSNGSELKACASGDEGGRLRIWEASRGMDPKGFRMIRFASAITSLAPDAEGNMLLVGTDSGCVHLVRASPWRKAQIMDTQRVSEAGVAKLCCCATEDGLKVAALLFDNRIAFCRVNLSDGRVKMLGYVEALGNVEDIQFHDQGVAEGLFPEKLLVVGTAQEVTMLWAVRAPPTDHEPRSADLDRDVCPVWSTKLSGEKRLEDKPTAVCSLTKKSVVVGFAGGGVKSYPVPTFSGASTARQSAAMPQNSFVSVPCGQPVSCLRASTQGSALSLAFASMDGSVTQVSAMQGSEGELITRKALHSPYIGGASQVSIGYHGKVLLSTGGSDGLLLWSTPEASIRLPPAEDEEDEEDEDDAYGDETQEDYAFELDDRDMQAFPCWAPPADGMTPDDIAAAAAAASGEGEDPEVVEARQAKQKAIHFEVDNLRRKIKALVDHNTNAPDLEKLDRKDFCVDFEERDAISAKTKERCDALRAQIDHENVARQLVRDRLIKEFWDPMRGKGCQIQSLMTSISVSNYPERTISEEESTTTRKLRMLRRSEQLEHQFLRSAQCPADLREDMVLEGDSFVTGREKYIVNWWPSVGSKADTQRVKQEAEMLAEHKAEAEQSAAQAAKEDGKKGGDKDAGAGKDAEKKAPSSKEQTMESVTQEQKFLYEPFELVTNSRRRLQIYLLQSLAAEYRMHFNELFEACKVDKRSIVDQMKEKCARIRSILGELQITENVPEPELGEKEEAEAVLKVQDQEISAAKYISPEERAALEKARLKEEERLRQLRENDAGQRALVQMMGGTLKTKKDLTALEITLEREPWMDQVAWDDMTEVQKAALAEFEAKEKALAEEQEKYRGQLHGELKVLRAGVQDLTQQFEGLLKELHHQRFAHDSKFFCQELYCARLQLALLQSVEDTLVRDQAQFDVEAAANKLKEAQRGADVFGSDVAAAKSVQDEKARIEKEASSAQNFRQQLAQFALENEAVTALLQLFRRKAGAKGRATVQMDSTTTTQLARAVAGEAQPVVLPPWDPFNVAAMGDPYPDLGVPERQDSPDAGLDDEPKLEDCPEGVDEAGFQRMLELRREKLLAEAEVQKGAKVLAEMAGLLTHLQNERDQARTEYDRLQNELHDHKELMDRELYDIELLFKLRQGQVEVPQAAVVTDYSDAIVIDQEVVQSRNTRILELGKDKVSTLNTIKEFRKKLSLLQWEYNMLDAQTKDLEERTKDVHMLRVTKDLQSLLKGGEEGRNKADADLLERKIEHLNSTTEVKEQALKKQYAMGNHAAKLRKQENMMLEKKLRELQQNVIQREHIRRLRAPAGGGKGESDGRPRVTGGGGRIEENEAAIKEAQKGFREVRGRQKLMEAAKRHTEEIELLRKELDRLRQKTFPSFVQLHEDRPRNPDYKS